MNGEDAGAAGTADFAPLDPAQVERISAVHRGFLYQHLYAAACLLTLGRTAGARVVVERDEDLEVADPERRVYVQIKTRGRLLQPADIAGAFERFDEMRAKHAAGERPGTAAFAVVGNVEPGPLLTQQLGGEAWPSDVSLITPKRADDALGLPPAWPDVAAALAWCSDAAASVPFGSLPPQTLAWKLCALAMHAATGARDRSFAADDMPDLLEQLVRQLQDFPEPPQDYSPQADEPLLVTPARARLIVGFSGAGKTAWASQAALHAPGPVAYFDVGDMPAASVANALARELAARFAGGPRSGGALLAESSGLGVLRACAVRLAEAGIDALVVLDNAHRLSADDLRRIIETAEGVRFVCLAQPWAGAEAVAAQLAIEVESLAGWTVDTIAARFRAEGAPLSLESAGRVRGLTGGLPLFVVGAARLTAASYGGNADALCDAVLERVHDTDTAQDVILQDTLARLPATAQRTVGALSLAEPALSRDEALAVLAAIGLGAQEAASALRVLRRDGLVTTFRGGRLSLHDALRPLAADQRLALGDGLVLAARQRLYEVLSMSLVKAHDVPRFSAVLRLMPLIGQAEALAELASDEMFYEQGDPRTLREEIERVADDPEGSQYDRFWAHDALSYWESRDGGVPDGARLEQMAKLVAAADFGPREHLALAFKQLVYFGSMGDRAELDRTYERARRVAQEAAWDLLLRYNYAVSVGRLGDWRRVEQLADRLMADWLHAVRLTEQQLYGVNGPALDAILADRDRSDLKRLADCVALWCTARTNTDQLPNLRRILATKLYASAQIARSAVTSGQEAADDFLQLMADPVGALEVMESLVLPFLRAAQLTDLVLPVRSHYAIVLAWMGRVRQARAELVALRQFSGSAEQAAMLAERAAFVEQIAAGRVRLVPRIPPPEALRQILGRGTDQPVRKEKIGRNAACPCGSGRKYKHCHGQAR